MILKGENVRGQLTIFIIIAIFAIGGVILFFTFRDSFALGQIPSSLEPAYTTFLSCLEEDALNGIEVLESQGGYIFLPDFSPGSQYMPFSSQLDFLGNGIPYWYYVSGNNIEKEQVPGENEMEEQLGDFIEDKIRNCNLENYYDDGFDLSFGEPEAKVEIRNDDVRISLDMNLNINKGEDAVIIRNHKVDVESKLGSLYNSAKDVYNYEQNNLFLENYGIDTVRLYAPVDGVELSCSPLIWNADDVFNNLQEAVESNTLALNAMNEKYFDLDLPVEHDVRFLNSKTWPNSFEVLSSDENILMTSPVGNQPGMGILGFCYVPYHFVYNIRYPVLVQVSRGDEIFQFPTAVVIQGNKARESLEATSAEISVPELCEQKNNLLEINVFDTKLNNIDAEISYECSGTKCPIGKTDSGTIKGEFPQCVNGFIIAKALGFKTTKYQFSVIKDATVDIVMDKLYEKEIKLKLGNQDYDGQATVSFVSDDDTKTIVYPEQKKINLSEGQYEVQVYIYKNASITIGETTTRECIDVPQSGVGGFFGLTREKCFNIEFPSQIVSSALAGGGKQNYYLLESELESSTEIEINSGKLPVPGSIEQLQNNYLLFDNQGLNIELR